MIGSERLMDLYEFAIKHWLTIFFGTIATLLAAGYRRTASRFAKEKESSKAMQAGLTVLLADRLTEMFDYCNQKGYCSICAKHNAELLFEAYHTLGGNGTMTELFHRLIAMPTEKGER